MASNFEFMYNVYILKLKDGSYYIGSTGDLKQRLEYHRSQKVKSTKNKLPFDVVCIENYNDRSSAQTREYQIKKWKSRKAIERLVGKVKLE